MQGAIAQLIEMFPIGAVRDRDIAEFNLSTDIEYDRIRDFLILHYHATTRDDFEFLEPCPNDGCTGYLAGKDGALATLRPRCEIHAGALLRAELGGGLHGAGCRAGGWDQRVDLAGMDELERAVGRVRSQVAERVAAMPSHADFIGRRNASIGPAA